MNLDQEVSIIALYQMKSCLGRKSCNICFAQLVIYQFLFVFSTAAVGLARLQKTFIGISDAMPASIGGLRQSPWLINRAIEGRKDQNTFATEEGCNWLILSLSVALMLSRSYSKLNDLALCLPLLCLMSCPFSIIASMFSFFFFNPPKKTLSSCQHVEQFPIV